MQLRKSIAGIIQRFANRLGYEIRRRDAKRDRADRAGHLIFEAAQTAFPDHQAKLTVFNTAQSFGVHFLPVHFYSPVPDTSAIPETTWTQRYDDLPNLRIDKHKITRLLLELLPYSRELADVPTEKSHPLEFYWNNPAFNGADGSLLYAMIRKHKPRRIIEIGSGFSTLIGRRALSKNGSGSYVCVEPYPNDSIRALAETREIELRKEPVQEIPIELFKGLQAGDILFVDSTHVVKTGSDVVYELLKIVPSVQQGVLVHVHDIFFPFEMPKSWVVDKQLFWNEQYLLMAFLAFNSQYEMLIPNMVCSEGDLKGVFSEVFPFSPHIGGGSFWFRRSHAPDPPTR